MKRASLFLLCSVSLVWAGCKDFGAQPTLPTAVQVTVSDVTIVEGETALLVISLSKTSDLAVVFDFGTRSGMATSGLDYDSVSGSDTIQPGITKDTIAITTVDDSTPEGSETLTFQLSALSSGEFADSVATVTIIDNDSVALIRFGTDIKPLLDSYCLACHGGASPQSGFSVQTYNTVITSGLRAPNVIASNSGGSRLYIATTTSPSRDIDRMPQGGPYLTSDQQNLIKTWIDQGALNN